MRHRWLLPALVGLAACDHFEAPSDPPLTFLGGHTWLDPSTPLTARHSIAVAFIDRDHDGRLAPMDEPVFPCETTNSAWTPRCRVIPTRVVVRSYSMRSAINGTERQGVAIWVQDARARPAAVPFCTPIGCSSEQPAFFDRSQAGVQFQQFWLCTAEPEREIGSLEIQVGSESRRISAPPHLRAELDQAWTADGLLVTATASAAVNRAYVRLISGGIPVWNSEQYGARLAVRDHTVSVNAPTANDLCAAGCTIEIDLAHVVEDEVDSIASATHIEATVPRRDVSR